MNRIRLFLAITLGFSLICGCGSGSSGPTSSPAPTDPPLPEPRISVQPAFTSLPGFEQPLAMLQAPQRNTRWYLVERRGRILAFENSPSASVANVYLDISQIVESNAGEAGLLGMAFHPNYLTNHQVFLSFTRPGLVSEITRYTSLDGGLTLDPGSAETILTVQQDSSNHNGGHIAFGPDGYLYFGLGDGGGANDPNGRAQDTSNLLGTMVRVDIDGGVPYGIPADNPFATNAPCVQGFGGGDCPEIYAWGLRNPWRWSFDSLSGTLWLGDVGQGSWEEIDRVELGKNYGWPIREGAHCNAAINTDCSTEGLTDPRTEYSHDLGISVTGGNVYRGDDSSSLYGIYLFADFGSGRIWGLRTDASISEEAIQLADTELNISSFAEAENGDLYVLDYSGGRIHRIVPN